MQMQCPKCAREVNSVDVKVCISEERVYELRLNDEGKPERVLRERGSNFSTHYLCPKCHQEIFETEADAIKSLRKTEEPGKQRKS